MRDRKYYIALDDFERRVVVNCLNEMRNDLLTSGKLNGYLADLDKQAEGMFSRLVKQMAECEGVTEQLKADNQSAWVGRMNNIRGRATEMVSTYFIYG